MRRYFFIVIIFSSLLLFSKASLALRPEFVNRTEFEPEFKTKYDKIVNHQGEKKIVELKKLYSEIKEWLKDRKLPRATRDRLYRSLLKLNHHIAWESYQNRDIATARSMLEECLEIIKSLPDAKLDNQKIYAMLQLAEIKRELGDEPESARLLSEVEKHNLKSNKRYQAFLDIGKARLLISKGIFSEAEALIAKAKAVFLAKSTERADLMYEIERTNLLLDQKLGRIASNQKSLDKTNDLIDADARAQKLKNYELWKTRQIQLGEVKLQQALTYANSYKFEKAIELSKQAYELFSQKDKNTQEMIYIRGIGECGIVFCESYLNQGLIELSINTVEGYNKFFTKLAGYHSIKAQFLLIAGNSYLTLGNSIKAEKSLAGAEKLLNGQIDMGLQARLKRFKAEIYKFKGQYGLALDALTDSISISAQGHCIKEEMKSIIALGDIFLIIGNLDAALLNFDKALKIAERIANMPDVIITQLRRVKVLVSKKTNTSLKIALEILMSIEPDSTKLQIPKIKTQVFDFIAKLYSIFNLNDKAVAYCKNALVFLGKTHPSYNLQLTVDFGKYLRLSGNAKDAADILYKAFNTAVNKFNDPFLMHQVLIEYALTEEALEHLEKAYQLYTKAAETADHIRTEILDRDNKALLNSKNRILFEKLVETAYKLKKYEKAFYWAESGKARAFVDKLSEVRTGINLNVDEKLKQEELRIIETLASCNKTLQSEQAQALPDEKLISALKNKINQLTQDYQTIRNKILTTSPQFSSLVAPKIAIVSDVRKNLSKNAVFLSYFLGENSSYLFEITDSEYKIHVLPAIQAIIPKVNYHRDLIISGASITLNEFYKSASTLGEMLLGEVKRKLSINTELIIAPSGILHYLPFETLSISVLPQEIKHTWASIPYLITRVNSISYIQSATVMLMMSQKSSANSKAKTDFVAFGNPIFPDEFEKLNKKISALGRRSERAIFSNIFPPLPNTGREVSSISNLFKDEMTFN
ncbi:MAG: CHAT domain-containing protein, partial [Planctomycetes bacterium]|nr:CHAT domain-containing protein [Planctomycetota bacterium]